MVNNAAGADLRATKMLIDMIEGHRTQGRRGGAAGAASPRPGGQEVIKHMVERIRGALLQEIQDMNAGNPALAMISLPPAEPVGVVVRQPLPADDAV
jgi:hypothetical protein